MGQVYRTMQSPEDMEIAGLLETKAILLSCVRRKIEVLPAKIGAWLFTTSMLLVVEFCGIGGSTD